MGEKFSANLGSFLDMAKQVDEATESIERYNKAAKNMPEVKPKVNTVELSKLKEEYEAIKKMFGKELRADVHAALQGLDNKELGKIKTTVEDKLGKLKIGVDSDTGQKVIQSTILSSIAGINKQADFSGMAKTMADDLSTAIQTTVTKDAKNKYGSSINEAKKYLNELNNQITINQSGLKNAKQTGNEKEVAQYSAKLTQLGSQFVEAFDEINQLFQPKKLAQGLKDTYATFTGSTPQTQQSSTASTQSVTKQAEQVSQATKEEQAAVEANTQARKDNTKAVREDKTPKKSKNTDNKQKTDQAKEQEKLAENQKQVAVVQRQLEARARLTSGSNSFNYSTDKALQAAAAEEMLKAEIDRINKEFTTDKGQPLASYKVKTAINDNGEEQIQSATLQYVKKDLGEIVTETYKWESVTGLVDQTTGQVLEDFEGLIHKSTQYSKNMEQIAKYEEKASKIQSKLNGYQDKLNSVDKQFIGEKVETKDGSTFYAAKNPIVNEKDLAILSQKRTDIEEQINGYKTRGIALTAEENQALQAQVTSYKELAQLMKDKEYHGGVLSANKLTANKAKETARVDKTINTLGQYEGEHVEELVAKLNTLKEKIKNVDSGTSLKSTISEFIELKGDIDNTIASSKELQSVNQKLAKSFETKYNLEAKDTLTGKEKAKLANVESDILRLSLRKQELTQMGVSDAAGNSKVSNMRSAVDNQSIEAATTTFQGYLEQLKNAQSAMDKINATGAKEQLKSLANEMLQVFAAFQQGKITFNEFSMLVHNLGVDLQPTINNIKNFGKEEQNVAKQAESLSAKLENALSLKNTNNKTNEYTQQIQALQGALSQIQANHKNGALNDEELKAEQQELKTIQELLDAIRSSSGYVATNGKGTIDSSTIGKVYGTEDIQAYLRNYGDSRNWKFKGFADDGMSASFKTLDGSLRSVKVSMDQVYDSTGKTSNVLRVLDKEAKSAGTGVLGVGKGIKQIAGYFTMYFTGYHMVTKALSEFRQGLSVFKEYDTALTQIKYTMNLTETEFQNLGHSAMEMAEDMSSSISNAMKVMEIYANMSTTTADMQEQAKSTLMLANVTGEDSGTAADQIQSVMQQFNMDSSQTEHIVDAYEKISQSLQLNFTTGIEGMAAAVKNVGAVANDAGKMIA